MKIRSQFVFTFLLLAVVPLAGIVFYSYLSSQRAVRNAVKAEAEEAAGELQERMDSVQQDLQLRVQRFGDLPFGRLMEDELAGSDEDKDWFTGAMLSELGDAATLVESFEFVPAAPEAPAVVEVGAIDGVPEVAPVTVRSEVSIEAPARPLSERWVIHIEQVLQEVEDRIEKGEIEVDSEEALVRTREGLAAAASIAEGVGEFIKAFSPSPDDDPDPEAVPDAPESDAPDLAWRPPPRPHLAPPPPGLERARLIEQQEGRLWHREAFGREFMVPIRRQGLVVGEVKTQVSGSEVLKQVLGRTRTEQGEIPFAVDSEGSLYATNESERGVLSGLPLTDRAGIAEDGGRGDDWVIVTSEDENSGLTFGIARPIGEPLQQIRAAAVRNFGLGIGLIGLALLGIVPLSGRMTRDLKDVTLGAERIAGGDLDTEVPVRSRNEIGQLATVFNRMTHELKESQEKLVQEEGLRRDQEVRESLLKAEYDRKTGELEEARRFQLSLLPKELPRHASFEVAVFMKTAAEVGGDYYDFRQAENGVLTVAVGDATGHGARAGTMVTVIKSLFSAHPPEIGLSGFLREANGAIKRMDLGRMAMALALARLEGGRLTIASAGMPPSLLYRAKEETVEEITLPGMPLGSLDFEYQERSLEVEPGDALLMMSDGFPELPDADGDPLGYERVLTLFEETAALPPGEMIGSFEKAAKDWAGDGSPNDDITFVALRIQDV